MNHYTIKVLLLSLAVLGLGATTYHRLGLQTDAVVNKTRALEVVSLKPTGPMRPGGRDYELVLRNVSAKGINGYSIAFGEGSTVTNDLTSGDRLIAPGDQFTEVLPHATNIVVRNVIFEDGSSDGDPVAAAELHDRREGMRKQLERIAPLLKAAAVSGDVEKLKAQLQALPEDTAAGDSVFINAGMRNAKEDTLLDVEKLDKHELRSGLARLAHRHDRRMTRLTKRVQH